MNNFNNGYHMQNVGGNSEQPFVPVPQKNKQAVYKNWWFWLIIVISALVIIGGAVGNKSKSTTLSSKSSVSESAESKKDKSLISQKSSSEKKTSSTAESSAAKVTVADFSNMSSEEIKSWGSKNHITCNISEDYSDTVSSGDLISQSAKAGSAIKEWDTVKVVISKGKKIPLEYTNALSKAQSYANNMNMSKKGVYEQLTSSYGEGFSEEAAEYAIANVKTDWKENAVKKGEDYAKKMNMSRQDVYEQLTSEYGEGFTAEEAQYAVSKIFV